MKRLNDGTWINFETKIGEFDFADANGTHRVAVYTDGEFWRVVAVAVDLPRGSLTPIAARKLAKLLLNGADVAEHEEGEILKQDAHD